MSSWPPRAGSTGSTIAASTSTAATSRRSNSRLPTTLNARDQPPAEVSDQRVSGLTGAVHSDPTHAGWLAGPAGENHLNIGTRAIRYRRVGWVGRRGGYGREQQCPRRDHWGTNESTDVECAHGPIMPFGHIPTPGGSGVPGRTGQGSGSGIPSRRPVAHGSSPWCTAKVLSGAQMQRVAVAQASTQPSADSEAPSRLLRFGSSHSRIRMHA
ncbi:Transposase (fragment) [Mycobacterium tuberculosis]